MEGTESRMRSLLGLALRARRLALGRSACRDAAVAGRLHLLLLARDAGASGRRDSGAGEEVPCLRLGVDQEQLGGWVNRDRVAVVGILDPHMAKGLLAAAKGSAAECGP